MLRVERRDDGTIVLHLHPIAAQVLKALPARLQQVLESPNFESKVVRRLFPRAYKDEDQEKEYQRLLRDDLLRRKLESIEAFEGTLEGWKPEDEDFTTESEIEIVVDKGTFDLWLGFVNDMRLLLGTELDIKDDAWSAKFQPSPDQVESLALLQFLGWLQEEILRASGSLG